MSMKAPCSSAATRAALSSCRWMGPPVALRGTNRAPRSRRPTSAPKRPRCMPTNGTWLASGLASRAAAASAPARSTKIKWDSMDHTTDGCEDTRAMSHAAGPGKALLSELGSRPDSVTCRAEYVRRGDRKAAVAASLLCSCSLVPLAAAPRQPQKFRHGGPVGCGQAGCLYVCTTRAPSRRLLHELHVHAWAVPKLQRV